MTKFEIQEVKKKIKQKFITIRRFCMATKMDESFIRYFLSGDMRPDQSKKVGQQIMEKIRKTKQFIDPRELTTTDRIRVKKGIEKTGLGIRGFCRQHPQYNPRFVSQVITGKKKLKDKRTMEFMNFLNISPKTGN